MTQDLPQEIYALWSAKIDTNNIYEMYLALLTIRGINRSQTILMINIILEKYGYLHSFGEKPLSKVHRAECKRTNY